MYASRDIAKVEVVINANLKALAEEKFENRSKDQKVYTYSHWRQICLYGEPERQINNFFNQISEPT